MNPRCRSWFWRWRLDIAQDTPSSAPSQNGGAALGTYIPVHYAAGDAKAVIAYYEAEMKTPAGAIDALNFCACSPLHLVLALQDAGHPDFKPLLAAWKRAMETQSELYVRLINDERWSLGMPPLDAV